MLSIRSRLYVVAFAALGAALWLASCGQQQYSEKTQSTTATETMTTAPTYAVATLHGTEGNDVQGTVTFSKENDSVKVVADVTGLTPGKHGFHIHQYGDCSAPDGTSAGGHFNPDNTQHGAPTDSVRHVGDLGNITADSTGHAHLVWVDPELAFSGPHSIIGRGVIVHAGEDDFVSQPTGNAGARVACGVIGVAKAPSSGM